ncbi:unnamed protein product [Tilletia caries]|uniref:Uncharacterized protein n=1 Tax=Tilletia caries TaxID=13290 RepID=A0A8T8T899_9BASI|nr:hypothetical protein A4X03_0g5218 [Tilletia caries]CAD6892270.1 unnamed protein product [Tilletia caries]
MGREQLRVKNNLTSQSLIQNHIGRVCERIQAAFKIATPSGQQKAMNASKSASAPSEAGPSVKKPRARVSKQLDQGIVSVEALKSAVYFLDKANIKYPNRSKKSDLIDVLIEPYSNNKIKITAEEVRLASSKVDQDNDK